MTTKTCTCTQCKHLALHQFQQVIAHNYSYKELQRLGFFNVQAT